MITTLSSANPVSIMQPLNVLFKPHEDISAFELAQLLPILFAKAFITESTLAGLGSAARHLERPDGDTDHNRLTTLVATLRSKFKVSSSFPWTGIDRDGDVFVYTKKPNSGADGGINGWLSSEEGGHNFLTTLSADEMANLPAWTDCLVRLSGSQETVAVTGAGMIAAERERQISAEGWAPEHDDSHIGGELLDAAICYAKWVRDGVELTMWPWSVNAWKPSEDCVRTLVKAGALIAAEIDRLQRASERTRLLVEKYGKARIGVDGNCGFALLGPSLAEGESEFAPIQPGQGPDNRVAAGMAALEALRKRLRLPDLAYYFEENHPTTAGQVTDTQS